MADVDKAAADEGAAADAWPLAEYTAMRAEILQCSQQMATLFNVLIAAVGVILGVALRPSVQLPNGLVVMLVLPAVSYLTAVRYVYLYTGAVRIGAFLETGLRPSAPRALRWESWLSNDKDALRADAGGWILRQGLADWMTFVGTAIVGLVGSGYAIFSGEGRAPTPLYLGWFLGSVLTFLTACTLVAKRNVRERLH